MDTQNVKVQAKFCGFLEGHEAGVTCISTGHQTGNDKESDVLISGGRDKKLIMWKINSDSERNSESFGTPFISLTGHSNFVSDLSLSTDNKFCLSSSWDNSINLWKLSNGTLAKRISNNHNKKSIFTTTFCSENRQIFSAGNDNKITLWNTNGEIKGVSSEKNHQDFVSKIRHSPSLKNKFFATVGWDGKLKLWHGAFLPLASIQAHDAPIYALSINTNGLYIATGGKDNCVKIWKVSDLSKPFKVYKTDSTVHDLAFNPEYQWIAIATEKSLRIFDVSNDTVEPIVVISPEQKKTKIQGVPKFTSLAWSNNGKYLYAGASDSLIRVHKIDIAEA